MRPSDVTGLSRSARSSSGAAGNAFARSMNSALAVMPRNAAASFCASARAGSSSSGFFTRTTAWVVRALGGRSNSVQRSARQLAELRVRRWTQILGVLLDAFDEQAREVRAFGDGHRVGAFGHRAHGDGEERVTDC